MISSSNLCEYSGRLRLGSRYRYTQKQRQFSGWFIGIAVYFNNQRRRPRLFTLTGVYIIETTKCSPRLLAWRFTMIYRQLMTFDFVLIIAMPLSLSLSLSLSVPPCPTPPPDPRFLLIEALWVVANSRVATCYYARHFRYVIGQWTHR